MEEQKDPMGWTLHNVWNSALSEDFVLQPRGHIWASELGKPYIDLWYKLRGQAYSNPPNDRSKRKFEAGNIWEWIVELILRRAGVIVSQQERCEWQYNGLIKVTGKADFVAGGVPNWEDAKDGIESIGLPDFLATRSEKVIQYLMENYPEGLGVKPLEIKSVSAYMFEALENKGRALKIHRLQLFHYLISLNYTRGDIIYICRDDNRMMQIPVYRDDEDTEKEYKDWIDGFTKCFASETPPELEKCIVFDQDMCKFTKNNQVAWSGYLTMLYGIQDQAEFDKMYMGKAASWNRVIARVKTGQARAEWLKSYGVEESDVQKEKAEGKKTATIQYIIADDGVQVYVPADLTKGYSMTPKNLEALEEIKSNGFDIDIITKQLVPDADDLDE